MCQVEETLRLCVEVSEILNGVTESSDSSFSSRMPGGPHGRNMGVFSLSNLEVTHSLFISKASGVHIFKDFHHNKDFSTIGFIKL